MANNKNNVVKITRDDGGEKIKYAKWCLIDLCNEQGSANLCEGQFFGIGESACEYETKTGKVTCPNCIDKIKKYQSIKL